MYKNERRSGYNNTVLNLDFFECGLIRDSKKSRFDKPLFHESGLIWIKIKSRFKSCTSLVLSVFSLAGIECGLIWIYEKSRLKAFHESGFFRIWIFFISRFNLLKSLRFKSGECGPPKGGEHSGLIAGLSLLI